jgi:hypothetical protein
MIHLANDPNASRMGNRNAPNDGESRAFDHSRSRAGHVWPFLSHHAGRPSPPEPFEQRQQRQRQRQLIAGDSDEQRAEIIESIQRCAA